jgi:hypothetical protein
MNLRVLAEQDLAHVLEDMTTGFGWAITLTDPSQLSKSLTGRSNDIARIVDPETGQVASGRLATVTLRISSIYAAGFAGLPIGIADSSTKPWLVSFKDINGNSCNFKVIQSDPDRALGVVVLTLEAYSA